MGTQFSLPLCLPDAPSKGRRLALLLGGTAVIALVAAQPAHAISLNDPAAAAAGGIANYYDSSNQFPNVVSLFEGGGSFCTGTLINSRTILTAGHCFFNPPNAPVNPNQWVGGPTASNPGLGIPSVSFTPIASPSDPNFSTVSSIFVNRNYNQAQSTANDTALITLAQPITSITPVTLMSAATAIPANGTTLVSVGYGANGTGTNCCNAIDNKRRVMNIEFGAYAADNPNTSQPFLYAQFRNPSSPNNPNQFNVATPTSPIEGGTAAGDSGGPVFVQTPTGIVQIGELRGGFNPVGPDSQYGDISDWTPLNLFLAWIAQNNPLRQVSAAPGNFNWSNQAAWVDSVPGVVSAVPTNTIGNVADYQFDIARYYQVTLSNPGTITIDINPTVDTLAITGAQSQLLLPAGFTLSTVLSTTLSTGTLAMSGGTLDSPEMLISGGLLTGNGTIISAGGNTGVCATGVCNTGGTVMPVGILAIQGNYTQSGGGVLAYQLSPAGASGTLAVSGAATLGGTLTAGISPGLYGLFTNYAVLTAGSVSGQFAQVSSALPSIFLSLITTYNPTSVDLTIDRTPFGAVPGLSSNQRAVGNALEAAYSTSLTGQQALFYENVLLSPTTNVLTQLSGESNAGASQIAAFQLNNELLLLMLNPFGLDRGGFGAAGPGPLGGGAISRFAPERDVSPEVAQAYAAVTPEGRAATYWTPRWNVWAAAFGGANNTNGDPAGAGTHSFAARTAGIAAGLDYKVTPDTLIGFALAGGDTGWGLAEGLGGGHSDVFQAGLYGSQLFGPAYLAFANYWTATSRSVVVASIDTLTASFNAQSWAGRAEAGYKLAWAPVNLTPYAAVQAQSFHTPDFSEGSLSGSTLYALSYASHTGSVTRAELGSWLSNNYLLAGDAVAVLFGRAAWAHDWQNDLQAAPTFLTLPTASFIVNGAKPASDLAVVTAGAELRLAGGISLMGKFDGEFGAGTSTYAGTARVRYAW
jgi:subtilase-type serine protease